MKRLSASLVMLLLVTGLTVLGCSSEVSDRAGAGWITLLDGANPQTQANWNRNGDANWRDEDRAIVTDEDQGK
jgi:hypothetical protein